MGSGVRVWSVRDFINRLQSFIRGYRAGARLLALSVPSEDFELLYILGGRRSPWWIRLSFIDLVLEWLGRYDAPGWGLEVEWPRVRLLRATN